VTLRSHAPGSNGELNHRRWDHGRAPASLVTCAGPRPGAQIAAAARSGSGAAVLSVRPLLVPELRVRACGRLLAIARGSYAVPAYLRMAGASS
jgi:hypothetical protein